MVSKNKIMKQIILLTLAVACLCAGCSSHKNLTLMPTPVLYQNSTVDPFAHLTAAQKSTRTKVFYATNRVPKCSKDKIVYGNSLDSTIHLGKATILMGNSDSKWADLYKFSLSNEQIEPLALTLEKTTELAVMPTKVLEFHDGLPPKLQGFVDSINSELNEAVDKEIMVYVHGTKVDFANSTILTAEIDHFAGRDFVGLAFAWPSHQNILYYLLGIDVRRALNSSTALQSLLVLLAEHTAAEHINILAYSAGCKVTSKALFELRQTYAHLDPDQLKKKLRLGATVFAAADVAIDVFEERLLAISDLAQQVVITVSDDDNVLIAAKKYMGGEFRAGAMEAESIEEAFIVENKMFNVEIIDVSLDQDTRGFDIIGHHYWYRHPWMSSDIIFLMRTDLPPARRGLSPAELEGVWYLSSDYPEKIRKAAKTELEGQW